MRSSLTLATLLLSLPGCGDDPLAQVIEMPGEGWTLAVLPDTQYYAAAFPEVFDAQTQWIREHQQDLRIAYVLHEGDVVDSDVVQQWDNASRSMHLLDGLVPYSVLPGNHDYAGSGGVASRQSMIDAYFPVSGFSWNPSLREVYQDGSIQNSAHVFEIDGRSYVVVSLEFGPRDAVVDWAKDVLSRYQDSVGIVITHAYLYNDGTRYDWATKGGSQAWNPHSYLDKLGEHVNDGQELWDRLIARAPNVRLVLSGHAIGIGYRIGYRDGAAPVHEIMADYQGEDNGGNGWLRLMRFAANGTITVRTFSPSLNRYRNDPGHQFVIALDAPAEQQQQPPPQRQALVQQDRLRE